MQKNVAYAAISIALVLVGGSVCAATWPFEPGAEPTLAPLLKKTTPAVVSVSVVAPGEQNPLANDPFFQRFFDLPQQSPPRQGLGSGVIVDAERGLILTNHHVVADAEGIVVVLSDRRRFDAELIGSDAGTDIAVLRIDADGLTALPFGDSESLEVGDFVVAIGNPFGLGQTATTGIVSALGRTGINIEGYEDFIQTDASINPGNSGGALIDLDGELMGINTAILAPAGGNVGIGFAVPSNMASAVESQILKYGEVRRGRLGISIQDITPDLADALSLDTDEGAIVSDIMQGSSAAAAGIMRGDVVVSVDGKAVANSSDLRNAIGFVRPGSEVVLTIVRDGDRKTIRATVGETPTEEQPQAREQSSEPLAGAEVAEIPPTDPRNGETDGVLVTTVEPGSRAAQSGLRAQDIITAVNREPVTSVDELNQRINDAGPAVALTVLRGDQHLYLVVRR